MSFSVDIYKTVDDHVHDHHCVHGHVDDNR